MAIDTAAEDGLTLLRVTLTHALVCAASHHELEFCRRRQHRGNRRHGSRSHHMAHESKTTIYAALAGNTAIALTKFGAAWWTGSSAMLSEAIHSLVDTGNQLLMLYGLRRSMRPATEEHPFGFGLELYFWTFVVAILIFGLGAGVSVLEGVDKILHPHPVAFPWVNYAVLGASMVFEGATWLIALRAFRRQNRGRDVVEAVQRSKDPTVFTVLIEDSVALVGLVIAAAGLAGAEYFGWLWLDGVASVLIGVLLAGTATFLARECKGLLMGESAEPYVRVGIRRIAIAYPGIVGVNEVLTMHFGPTDILAVLSLDFDDGLTAKAVEMAVSGIERRIKHEYPKIRRVFVEAQSRGRAFARATGGRVAGGGQLTQRAYGCIRSAGPTPPSPGWYARP